MTWTTTLINDKISRIPRDVIFTTRDMLNCGSRVSVDKHLQKLVKQKKIFRAVPGVFIQERREITLEEIAQVKLRSFKKNALTHPADTLVKLGIGKGNAEPTFVTEGCKSSFKFLFTGQRIYIKKVCRRKMSLGDSNAGKVMRALWYCREINEQNLAAVNMILTQSDHEEIANSYAALPHWINDVMLEQTIDDLVPQVRESTAVYQLRSTYCQPSLAS